jgi:cyclic pyranopterin phosphate synthase
MVEHATKLGLDAYVNTNGHLLKSKIDELFAAGMRWATVGFYGMGPKYDRYTQRPGGFAQLEKSLGYVRDRYGDKVELQLNWLLMRPSCTLEALTEAWRFADRFNMALQVNLLSYSLDFFTNGPNGELRFTAEDRETLQEVGAALLQLKDRYPHRFPQSRPMIRAIPDLLMNGPESRIPCDAYDSLWVGADGTVQLCDTAFKLGNAKEQRLRDILFGDAHRRACRDAFLLKCVNCHCKMDTRILKHPESMSKYAGAATQRLS